MKSLKQYLNLQQEIYDYFGYQQDWEVMPLDDCTEYYWRLDSEDDEEATMVYFAKSIENLMNEESGDYYSNEIYVQRFLSKLVYRGKDYTMVIVDTQTDNNKFLSIFDNSKEINNE